MDLDATIHQPTRLQIMASLTGLDALRRHVQTLESIPGTGPGS